MTIEASLLACKNQPQKAKRHLMRARGWRDKDWYDNWPQEAPLWEAALRIKNEID